MDFKEKIRIIDDFPEKGISFKDITTLLQDGPSFRLAIDALLEKLPTKDVDVVVGPEARGFVIGAPVAYALKAGFVPVRKPGKLPASTINLSYELEYRKDSLEMHEDAIKPGQKVLVVDDLLATGGTTQATIKLIERLGGIVVAVAFMIELEFLNGRKGLKDYNVYSLVKY